MGVIEVGSNRPRETEVIISGAVSLLIHSSITFSLGSAYSD